jgi:Lon protease-like protein
MFVMSTTLTYGSRRFGMVGYDRELGRMNEWAAEVEIVECEPFADGRYYINILGRRRCMVLSSRDQDGYVLARVRYVKDAVDDDLAVADDEGETGGEAREAALPSTSSGSNAHAATAAMAAVEARAAAVTASIMEATGAEEAAAAAAAAGAAWDAANVRQPPRDSVAQLVATADALVQKVLAALTALDRGGGGLNPRAVHQIRSKMDSKPPASDPEALSWRGPRTSSGIQ